MVLHHSDSTQKCSDSSLLKTGSHGVSHLKTLAEPSENFMEIMTNEDAQSQRTRLVVPFGRFGNRPKLVRANRKLGELESVPQSPLETELSDITY